MNIIELKHYKLIKTIAEEGSIANSSEKLFLTQSALSHQLRELEERLGFKIFLRSRNNWQLTASGEELYQLANQLLDTIDEGFNKIQLINRGSAGQIKIATECYSFYQGLPSFIGKMSVLYPEIEVEIIIEATHQPIPKLVARDIDMALATYSSDSKEIAQVKLFEDEVVCILHKEHPLASEACIQPAHFKDVHLLIHSFPLETVAVYTHFLEPQGIIPKKITAIPFLSVVFEMISFNMGMICLPQNILKSFNISDKVVVRRLGTEGLIRQNYLLYRREDQHKQYIRDFIDNMREEFDV